MNCPSPWIRPQLPAARAHLPGAAHQWQLFRGFLHRLSCRFAQSRLNSPVQSTTETWKNVHIYFRLRSLQLQEDEGSTYWVKAVQAPLFCNREIKQWTRVGYHNDMTEKADKNILTKLWPTAFELCGPGSSACPCLLRFYWYLRTMLGGQTTERMYSSTRQEWRTLVI